MFFRRKTWLHFGIGFRRLLEGFQDAWPSKIELSCIRNAHFDKITFFSPSRFLDAKWLPNASQNGPQKHKKTHQKNDAFFDRKNIDFLWKIEPTGDPKSTPKSRIFLNVVAPPSGDPPKLGLQRHLAPKWTQNDSKMEPKWRQNIQKWGWYGNNITLKLNENWMQNGYKNDPNIHPKGNKNEPKFILLPVLGNPSSPGPERVIAAGNWDPLRAGGARACWGFLKGCVGSCVVFFLWVVFRRRSPP